MQHDRSRVIPRICGYSGPISCRSLSSGTNEVVVLGMPFQPAADERAERTNVEASRPRVVERISCDLRAHSLTLIPLGYLRVKKMMVSDVSSYSDTPASVPSTLASKRESVGLSTTVTLMSPTVPEGRAVTRPGTGPLTAVCRVSCAIRRPPLNGMRQSSRRSVRREQPADALWHRRCRGRYVGPSVLEAGPSMTCGHRLEVVWRVGRSARSIRCRRLSSPPPPAPTPGVCPSSASRPRLPTTMRFLGLVMPAVLGQRLRRPASYSPFVEGLDVVVSCLRDDIHRGAQGGFGCLPLPWTSWRPVVASSLGLLIVRSDHYKVSLGGVGDASGPAHGDQLTWAFRRYRRSRCRTRAGCVACAPSG